MASYTSLEPTSLSLLGIKAPSFNGASELGLYDVTSAVFTMLFMAAILAATYRFVVASLYMLEASEQGQSKAKAIFKQTILGLLGIFLLFPLLLLLNRQILVGDVGGGLGGSGGVIKNTNTISKPIIPSTQNKTITNKTPSIPANNDDPVGWNAIKSDYVTRKALAELPNGGITVNNDVCLLPTQRNCTTVGGWPSDTFSMLSQLRNTCPGEIVVSGGTEAGHSTHGPGKAPVDLSLNVTPGLEGCIRAFPVSNTQPKKKDGSLLCKKVYTNFGWTFCDEISVQAHWHVYKQ